MADQSSAAPQEREEAPEETAAEEEQKEAKPPLIPPVVVRFGILGAILAVVGIGAVFLVTDVIAPKLRAMGEPTAAVEEEEAPAKAHKAEEPGQILTIEDLVVNPAGTAGRRYLKVSVGVEVHDKKLAAEFEERQAVVRDLLIRDLSARTLDELTDPVAKEEMRQSIVEGLNEVLGGDVVSNLYFTDYVIQ